MFHDVDGPVTRHLMELIFLAIVFCYTNFQIKAENIFKKTFNRGSKTNSSSFNKKLKLNCHYFKFFKKHLMGIHFFKI